MVAIETARKDHPALAQLEPSDGEALRRLFYRLSPETVYRRFMSPLARPEQARPERLLDVDHKDREAIVAVVEGEIVGVARYSRKPGTDVAEMAVVVADEYQRRFREHKGPILDRLLAELDFLARYTLYVPYRGASPDVVREAFVLMGPTDPVDAPPGSIRGDYATVIGENIVHGSDSPESAARELKLFFGG